MNAEITKQKKYSLLIFDWDGTLMDSAARIVICMQRAAERVGLPPVNEVAVRNMIGLSLEVAVKHLFPGIDASQHQEMVNEFRRQSMGSEIKISPLFQGVHEILNQLSAQGYQLAVATGKSRHGLDKDIADAGVGKLFPITRTADETFSKPNPLMLEEILTDYNLAVTDALMIGDTEYDMQMAVNAGMDALAVTYGVHNSERMLRHRPKGFIDKFSQLPEWLNEIS